MGKKITDKVTWVGKVDWELKTFMDTNIPPIRDHLIIPIY